MMMPPNKQNNVRCNNSFMRDAIVERCYQLDLCAIAHKVLTISWQFWCACGWAPVTAPLIDIINSVMNLMKLMLIRRRTQSKFCQNMRTMASLILDNHTSILHPICSAIPNNCKRMAEACQRSQFPMGHIATIYKQHCHICTHHFKSLNNYNSMGFSHARRIQWHRCYSLINNNFGVVWERDCQRFTSKKNDLSINCLLTLCEEWKTELNAFDEKLADFQLIHILSFILEFILKITVCSIWNGIGLISKRNLADFEWNGFSADENGRKTIGRITAHPMAEQIN